jgi:tetratricopeptide (TPR) repeat protein
LNDEEEIRSAGIYLYNQGKYENALSKFLLTSQQDPSTSMMYLGFCYTRLEQPEAAISALESIFYDVLSPAQYMQSKLTLGYLYIENSELEKAESLFEALSDYDAENSQVFSLWGYVAQLQGQYDTAVRRYHKSIQIDPGNASALNSLAYLYALIGDEGSYADALGYARRAVAMSPNNASYLDTLGWICLKLNKKSDALEYLQRALVQREHDPVIKEHLEAARKAAMRRE